MIEEFLQGMHPVLQALIAGSFTWAATSLGSAMVFVKRELSRKLLNTRLGFVIMMILDVGLS